MGRYRQAGISTLEVKREGMVLHFPLRSQHPRLEEVPISAVVQWVSSAQRGSQLAMMAPGAVEGLRRAPRAGQAGVEALVSS